MKNLGLLSSLIIGFTACSQPNNPSFQGRWEGNWSVNGVVQWPERLYITEKNGQLTAKIQMQGRGTTDWDTASFTLIGKRNGNNISFIGSDENVTININGTIDDDIFSGTQLMPKNSPLDSGTFSFKKMSDFDVLLPEKGN